ncbi:MAG: LCP family protein [Lachnospiraceae bacterium]
MRKSNKRIPVWCKILLGILIFLTIIIIAGVIFVYNKLGKINHVIEIETLPVEEEFFEIDETAEADKDMIQLAPEDVTWSDTVEVKGEDDIVNILLIGQDRRPGESRARSDTMIIASVNKTDKTITLISLMRDMYVRIPGYSDNRINAAYAFGGMKLLDETIKLNFDIDIDGNVEVDFYGFCDVVDALGGVDIDVKSYEIDSINAGTRAIYLQRKYTSEAPVITTAGTYHLNGAQALSYARIRYQGNADYERTQRQRLVLVSLFNKLKTVSISEMLKLADTVLPMVNTDMTSTQIIGLATDVLMMGVGNIETHNIPQEASYHSANIRGMSVLVPDLDDCRTKLSEFIYE